MEVEARWRSKAPTHNGGRSSSSEATNLLTSKTTRLLKSQTKERMLKLKESLLLITMDNSTRNGMSLILIMLQISLPRELITNLVSISTDHSTSDLECQ
jgi:hypothetical protein